MKITSLWLSAAFAVALTGCVSKTLIVPTPPQAQAATPPQTGIPTHRTIQATKTAIAGQKMKLDFLSALHPDCSFVGYFTVLTTVAPTHGGLEIVKATDYTNYPKENQRYGCNVKPSPGTLSYYTPAPGFSGTDSLTLDVITPDGFQQTEIFTINVK